MHFHYLSPVKKSLGDDHKAFFKVLNMDFTKGRVNSFRVIFLTCMCWDKHY